MEIGDNQLCNKQILLIPFAFNDLVLTILIVYW